MAIDTLDKVGAGALPPVEFWKPTVSSLTSGRPFSYFYTGGIPGAAVAPSPGMSGAALTSYSGQLSFTNPVSGTTELARAAAFSTVAGVILLCDRLWHNSGIDVTSIASQTINSVAFPARDAAGSTNGEGVIVGLEVSTVTGAGTPTLTLGYTNSSGTAGRTSVNIPTTTSTSIAGSFFPFGLQGSDTGIRSIQTYQQSATWTSGTIHLVAYRVLARLEFGVANMGSSVDWLTAGGPQAYDNTVPFLIHVAGGTSAAINGHVIWTQG